MDNQQLNVSSEFNLGTGFTVKIRGYENGPTLIACNLCGNEDYICLEIEQTSHCLFCGIEFLNT